MKTIPKGSNYVPAICNHTMYHWLRHQEFAGRNFEFFNPGKSFFDYNIILQNAYYRLSYEEDYDHRSRMKYPDDTIILGDSGGFQMMTFERKGKPVDLNAIQILRWLERNSDIGMNLDVPPSFMDFDAALSESCRNFKIFEENRQNYDFKLYNVLHGKTYDQIDQWYHVVKDFSFDGWALGIHPSTNVYLKLVAYLYLIERGEESVLNNCHFFGVSAPANMISLSMLANKYDSALTFDSSSWAKGYQFMSYGFPLDIKKFVSLGEKSSDHSMIGMPCDCPVCSSMNIGDIYNYTPITSLLVSFHNLYQYLEVNRMIECFVDDMEVLPEYAKALGEKDLIQNVTSIFDDFDKHGSRYVYDHYHDLFVKPNNNSFESNLFGWQNL